MAISTPKPEKPADEKPAAAPVADTDRVAMVSRDKNGNPDQADGYEIIVPDDEKDAAENKPVDGS